MKVCFSFIETIVYLLFAVLYQAFKPRLLVPWSVLNWQLGDCQFLALNFFLLILFSVLGMYASSDTISDAAFSYSGGMWKISVI